MVNGFIRFRLLRGLLAGGLFGCATLASAANYILEITPAADLMQLGTTYGFQVARMLDPGAVLISTTQPLSAASLKALGNSPGIREIEPDLPIHSSEEAPASKAKVALETLGDVLSSSGPTWYFGAQVRSGYSSQRAGDEIHIADAQAQFGGGTGLVAIIDSGVDTTHPALAGSLVQGYDFTRDRFDTVSELSDLDQSTVVILDQSAAVPLTSKTVAVTLDQSTVVILDQSTVVILDGNKLPGDFGHGTMVAGLVHLVAPKAQILPLKAFAAGGSANLSDIIRAIRYAADRGANVINMSFDFPAQSPELQAAVTYAVSKGAILVAAAGNEGQGISVYPAALPQVVGVGSVNYSDKRSPFSNHGRSARTSAPGEALITTFPGNNYAGVWGTSFSAALVSGAVSLMQQVQPKLRLDTLRDCLDAGVQIDQDMGDARLDLVRSLTSCARSHADN